MTGRGVGSHIGKSREFDTEFHEKALQIAAEPDKLIAQVAKDLGVQPDQRGQLGITGPEGARGRAGG